MKRITPLLIALMFFGSVATSSGCIVRTRDRHHHHVHEGRRGPPPKAKHRGHRDHRDNRRGNDRCRWERC